MEKRNIQSDKPETKWNPVWLENLDKNGDIMKKWCRQSTSKTFSCLWCIKECNFTSQGLYALKQNAATGNHKKMHLEHNDKKAIKISSSSSSSLVSCSASSSSVSSFFKPSPAMSLKPSLEERTSNAEILWMLKVTESDYSLKSCENIKQLFKRMFDCDVTNNTSFSLGRNKVSYCLSDGLGPEMLQNLCSDVSATESGFTLLFDETTNEQNKKQMDILIRYWSDSLGEIVTSYLDSLKFARCDHQELKEKFLSMFEDDKFKEVPWDRFFNISSDGPNINKALYRELNLSLRREGKHGLLPLFVCCLHITHNAFHKGIDVFGQESEQLAFDLHAWFKQAPCKEEDYRKLAEDATLECESLFLRHLNTRWLTLVPALERVEKRWHDVRNYFLTFVKNKAEYKSSLPKNKKYARIVEALKDEQKIQLQISFLKTVAPVFTRFLRIFQGEGPLVHILYHELQSMLSTLMLRFLKADMINNKDGHSLLEIDVRNSEIQLDLEKMNVGVETLAILKKCNKDKRIMYLKEMQEAFCKMTEHLQKNLPLDSTFLKDMVCLHPLKRESTTSFPIARIAQLMPHILKVEKISILKDEWEHLRVDNDIKEEWYIDEDGNFKRLDHYWNQIFKLKSLSGLPRYPYLALIVKSCCALQNGNAAVERSLSDNKNTLSKERTSLGDDTLKALRRGKEFCRRNGGSHNVIVTRSMRESVRKAYTSYTERKKQEQMAAAALATKIKEEAEEKKKAKELMEKAHKKKEKLSDKEAALAADEAKADKELVIANRLLKEGSERLSKAAPKGDMEEVESAAALVKEANEKINSVKIHRAELKKVREKLTKKRSSLMDAVIAVKKKKY